MRCTKSWIGVTLLLGCTFASWGANLEESSLAGQYFVRHVQLRVSQSGETTEISSLLATAVFDGAGGYTFWGTRVAGTTGGDFNGGGTYTVTSNGIIEMTNPQEPAAVLNARLGTSMTLIGSTTETAGLSDLFIAVPAPADPMSDAYLQGTYRVISLEFPEANTSLARSSFFPLTADGAGQLADFTVEGMAANLGGEVMFENVNGASYSIFADASGLLRFPDDNANLLLSGTRVIYLSADGSMFIGGSTSHRHDLVVGIRAMEREVTDADWNGLFWSAGLRFAPGSPVSFAGSANSTGTGTLVFSRRLRAGHEVIDFTGANAYQLDTSGVGTAELTRVALCNGGNAFVGAGLSALAQDAYEVYFGIRPATPDVGTVFLHPNGIVNAASFAPVGNPVSPGAFVTLFGAGLAPGVQTATALPFPLQLLGVEVLVNGQPAPVYAVSPTQVSFLVPNSASGDAVSISVSNNGELSNEVTQRLAATSPGVFTNPPVGTGPGAILKADWSLVSTTNPARRGEPIQIFLTGLGAVEPPVAGGAAAPVSPLSWVTADIKVYIGGKEAALLFKGLAPTMAGLYQLNVIVANDTPIGDAIPLAVETPDAFHDQVDVAIAP